MKTMKSTRPGLAVLIAAGSFAASSADAALILFEDGLNIDGVTSSQLLGDALPSGVDDSAFDYGTGLGVLEVTVTGAGSHSVLAYFDHEIDEGANTFFNERGASGGAAPIAGQSWEIDEPGFGSSYVGDIWFNWVDDLLDETAIDFEEDIAMSLGFQFDLLATQTAVVRFFLDVINNAPGFFLTHWDPHSIENELSGPNQVFFWGTLSITGDDVTPPPTTVPEPGPLALLAAGLLGLGALRRRSGRPSIRTFRVCAG